MATTGYYLGDNVSTVYTSAPVYSRKSSTSYVEGKFVSASGGWSNYEYTHTIRWWYEHSGSGTTISGGSASRVAVQPANNHPCVAYIPADAATSITVSDGTTCSGGTWHYGTVYTCSVSATTGGTATVSASKVLSGGSVTYKAKANSGYVFTGWSDGGTEAEYSVTVTSDKSLKASFAKLYTLTFGVNDSSRGSCHPTSFKGVSGSAVDVDAFPATGYHFTGWTNSSGSLVSTSSAASFSVGTSNQTYKANFDANVYYVNFSPNGGTGSMAAMTCSYGSSYNLTALGFGHASFTVSFDANGGSCGTSSLQSTFSFAGWTGSNGGSYADGAAFSNLSADHGGSVTMSANWSQGAVTLPSATRTGYAFAGWTGAGAAGASYRPGSNCTLKASWTARSYTVTLDGNGGTGGSASVSATYAAAMPAITLPSRADWRFVGYFSASGTKYYNADGSSARNCDFTANTTLTARWEQASVIIQSGNSSYGLVQYKIGPSGTYTTASASQSYATGSTNSSTILYLRAAPVAGYVFTGWSVPSGASLYSGQANSASSDVIAMRFTDADLGTYTANFRATTLAVASNNGSFGTVSITKVNGAACTAKSSHTGKTTDVLTLTATPATNYYLKQWSETVASGTVTVGSTSRTVTATFALKTLVTARSSNSAYGTVSVAGGASAASATHYAIPGASVSLAASVADANRYYFSAWSDKGAQSHSISAPATDTTYTATFLAKTAITVAVDSSAKGEVSVDGGTSYASTATAYRIPDETLTIRARAKSGYFFAGWADKSSDNPRTVTAGSSAATYTAKFQTIPLTVGAVDTVHAAPYVGTAGTSSVDLVVGTTYTVNAGLSATHEAAPAVDYWQSSTDGSTWTTYAAAGGRTSFTWTCPAGQATAQYFRVVTKVTKWRVSISAPEHGTAVFDGSKNYVYLAVNGTATLTTTSADHYELLSKSDITGGGFSVEGVSTAAGAKTKTWKITKTSASDTTLSARFTQVEFKYTVDHGDGGTAKFTSAKKYADETDSFRWLRPADFGLAATSATVTASANVHWAMAWQAFSDAYANKTAVVGTYGKSADWRTTTFTLTPKLASSQRLTVTFEQVEWLYTINVEGGNGGTGSFGSATFDNGSTSVWVRRDSGANGGVDRTVTVTAANHFALDAFKARGGRAELNNRETTGAGTSGRTTTAVLTWKGAGDETVDISFFQVDVHYFADLRLLGDSESAEELGSVFIQTANVVDRWIVVNSAQSTRFYCSPASDYIVKYWTVQGNVDEGGEPIRYGLDHEAVRYDEDAHAYYLIVNAPASETGYDKVITAYVIPRYYNLSCNVNGNIAYGGVVVRENGTALGDACLNGNSKRVEIGQTVRIEATATFGGKFEGFNGSGLDVTEDLSSATNIYEFTMPESDVAITATFSRRRTVRFSCEHYTQDKALQQIAESPTTIALRIANGNQIAISKADAVETGRISVDELYVGESYTLSCTDDDDTYVFSAWDTGTALLAREESDEGEVPNLTFTLSDALPMDVREVQFHADFVQRASVPVTFEFVAGGGTGREFDADGVAEKATFVVNTPNNGVNEAGQKVYLLGYSRSIEFTAGGLSGIEVDMGGGDVRSRKWLVSSIEIRRGYVRPARAEASWTSSTVSGVSPHRLSYDGQVKMSGAFADGSSLHVVVTLTGHTSLSSKTITARYRGDADRARGSLAIYPLQTGYVMDGEKAQSDEFTGQSCTVSAMPKPGYAFVGWYESPEAAAPVSTSCVHSFKVGAPRTLYAAFREDRASVVKAFDSSGDHSTFTWRSKVFVADMPLNWTAARVYADLYPVYLSVYQGSSPNGLANGLVDKRTFTIRSQNAIRLPTRRPEKYFVVEVTGNTRVNHVAISTSMEGLRNGK